MTPSTGSHARQRNLMKIIVKKGVQKQYLMSLPRCYFLAEGVFSGNAWNFFEKFYYHMR